MEPRFNVLSSDKEVLVSLINSFGITESELIDIIGCSGKQMWRVLHGMEQSFKGNNVTAKFTSLKFLIRSILLSLPAENVATWLREPNKVLNNRKPIDILVARGVKTLDSWVKLDSYDW